MTTNTNLCTCGRWVAIPATGLCRPCSGLNRPDQEVLLHGIDPATGRRGDRLDECAESGCPTCKAAIDV